MVKGEVKHINADVYLEFTGIDFRLFTSGGEKETAEIYLDECTAATLVDVLQKCLEEES